MLIHHAVFLISVEKSLYSKWCKINMRDGGLIITQFIVKKSILQFLGEEVWAFHAHVVRQIAIMFGKAAGQA